MLSNKSAQLMSVLCNKYLNGLHRCFDQLVLRKMLLLFQDEDARLGMLCLYP
jgi:hypothetical protein